VLTDYVFNLYLMNLNHMWYVSIVLNIFLLKFRHAEAMLDELGSF
jgi:hypothetical protein